MGFTDVLDRIERRNFSEKMENYTEDQVRRALGRERCDQEDFLALLSPAARPWLEEIAVRAQDISVRNFGRTMHLFTPHVSLQLLQQWLCVLRVCVLQSDCPETAFPGGGCPGSRLYCCYWSAPYSYSDW